MKSRILIMHATHIYPRQPERVQDSCWPSSSCFNM